VQTRLSNLDLRLLETLVAVGDTGSYTRAADELSLTQPSVFRQIKKLEAQLGATLVELDGKRVRLTEAGRVAYQYGRRLLLLAEGLGTSMELSRSALSGTLIVGATPSIGEFPLAAALLAYHEHNPDIQFRVRVALLHNAEIDHLVADGSLDLALHANPTPRPGLVKERLFTEPLVVVAPRGHRFEGLPVIAQTDLVPETLIYHDQLDSAVVRTLEDEWLARAGVRPNWWVACNSDLVMRALVRGGGGVGIVSEHSARRPGTELIVRPLADSPERDVFVVRRAAAEHAPLATSFREFLLGFDWEAWRADGREIMFSAHDKPA
jgi:DNA-binding transcriptional LysR family regulator